MLTSQLEIVEQAKQFLASITAQDYLTVLTPHFSGSAGAHMRHILDHYLALMNGSEQGAVDYNVRHRDSDVEVCVASAQQVWMTIEKWLMSIEPQVIDQPISVTTEVSSKQCESAVVNSTLARELVFVASHAIHHFSLMAIIRSMQGERAPDNFGIAPATLTHQLGRD